MGCISNKEKIPPEKINVKKRMKQTSLSSTSCTRTRSSISTELQPPNPVSLVPFSELPPPSKLADIDPFWYGISLEEG